ncbi:DoxX family protein [Leptothoe sp. LEGE 181152]|nr:DoxX family protein [Leptothoe sp. LEGE 181152]
MASPQATPKVSTVPSLLQVLLASNTSNSSLFQVFWLVARLAAGGLMIHNGLDKLADIQGFADNVVSYIGLPYPVFFTYCAAYIEVVSAVLIMLGLLSRPNALALLATMGVAIFFHIKGNGLKVTPLETASLYATFYTFFLVNGPGQWSLDELIAKKIRS